MENEVRTSDFLDERLIDAFAVENASGSLVCSIKERWVPVLARVIKCGAKLKETIRRQRGVRSAKRESIEGQVEASLGLPGLGEFKSAIAAKTEREWEFQELQEETSEYEFCAPPCGSLWIGLYQKTRVYEFIGQKQGWTRVREWRDQIVEWLPEVHQSNRTEENEPECKCREPAESKRVDGLVLAKAKNFSFIDDYSKFPDGKVMLNSLNHAADWLELQSGKTSLKVSRNHISPALLYLAYNSDQHVQLTLRPFAIRPLHSLVEPQTKFGRYSDVIIGSGRVIVSRSKVSGENIEVDPLGSSKSGVILKSGVVVYGAVSKGLIAKMEKAKTKITKAKTIPRKPDKRTER
jgi:hypothetical protein